MSFPSRFSCFIFASNIWLERKKNGMFWNFHASIQWWPIVKPLYGVTETQKCRPAVIFSLFVTSLGIKLSQNHIELAFLHFFYFSRYLPLLAPFWNIKTFKFRINQLIVLFFIVLFVSGGRSGTTCSQNLHSLDPLHGYLKETEVYRVKKKVQEKTVFE